jgi:hypothetical protein
MLRIGLSSTARILEISAVNALMPAWSSPAPTPSAASPDPPATRRTPCANGSTSAPQSRIPYTPEPSSSCSLRPLRSDTTDLQPAQVATSSSSHTLSLSSVSLIRWHISSRALHFIVQAAQTPRDKPLAPLTDRRLRPLQLGRDLRVGLALCRPQH